MAKKPSSKKQVPVIKIIKLRNGETLVAQMIHDSNDIIILSYPMLLDSFPAQDERGNIVDNHMVMKPWIDGSSDILYNLFVEDVLLVCNPDELTLSMYDKLKREEIGFKAQQIVKNFIKKAESLDSANEKPKSIDDDFDEGGSNPWSHHPRIHPES